MLNKYHVGKKELLTLDEKESDKKKTEYISEYYNGKEDGGYEESEIHITLYKDGSLSLHDYNNSEGWVSLHQEQVEHLKKILKKNNKILKENKK